MLSKAVAVPGTSSTSLNTEMETGSGAEFFFSVVMLATRASRVAAIGENTPTPVVKKSSNLSV